MEVKYIAMRNSIKKTKTILLTAFFLFSSASFGETHCAKVAAVVGKATNQDGIMLKVGLSLPKDSKITTRESGWVKLLLIDDSIIDLGSSSELTLTSCQTKNLNTQIELEMELGAIRALVNKNPKKKRDGFQLKTGTSFLGVRGTEFFVTRQENSAGEVIEKIGVREGLLEVRSLFDDSKKPSFVNAGTEFQAAGRISRENGTVKVDITAPPKIDQFSAEEQRQAEERTKIDPDVLKDAVDLSPEASNNKSEKSDESKLARFIEETQRKEREVSSDSNTDPKFSSSIITSNDPTSAGAQSSNIGNSGTNGPTPVLIKTSGTWNAEQ